uniref:Uncharacterized protein n=1 Tax=Ciona intestinalis TaxID=7719 RepID=H2XM51_CIOIN
PVSSNSGRKYIERISGFAGEDHITLIVESVAKSTLTFSGGPSGISCGIVWLTSTPIPSPTAVQPTTLKR